MNNKRLTSFLFPFILSLCIPFLLYGECANFVQIHSAKTYAKELGKSEAWVLNNFKINLWEKQTDAGKGKVVGHLLPGSNALIIEVGMDDYRVTDG